MLEVWLPLLACGLIGATWFHVLRLREHATAHARELCQRHGLQLLDGSVALHRLHVRRRDGALRVTREYRFDTSRGGDDRQTAGLTVSGGRVIAARLPTPDPPEADAGNAGNRSRTAWQSPPVVKIENKVVPITRRRRTSR